MLRALASGLVAETGVQARALPLDLARPDAAETLIEQVQGLEIGLLVLNAARSAIGPFLRTPLEDHLGEIETNIRTPMILAHRLGGPMAARGRGGIILMSSMSAMVGSALIANYAATKAYSRVLGEGLWEELRGQGVDVLVSSPGAVATPNYNNSLQPGERTPVGAQSPEVVVRETLDALGRRAAITPGRSTRMQGFFMARLLPRSAAIRMMGRVLRGMYEKES